MRLGCGSRCGHPFNIFQHFNRRALWLRGFSPSLAPRDPPRRSFVDLWLLRSSQAVGSTSYSAVPTHGAEQKALGGHIHGGHGRHIDGHGFPMAVPTMAEVIDSILIGSSRMGRPRVLSVVPKQHEIHRTLPATLRIRGFQWQSCQHDPLVWTNLGGRLVDQRTLWPMAGLSMV